MHISFKILLVILTFYSCKPQNKEQNKGTKHVFYLHGRIIEQEGTNAVSDVYGAYEFDNILKALAMDNTIVHGDVRTENVDARGYAQSISKEINTLIQSGIKPTDITIIGASKGAIIAAHLSDINANPINYVLLAGNNTYQEENNNWILHGQILCIYEVSDTIAGKDYNHWNNTKNNTTLFEQIELNTGLGHGFIYRPIKEWMEPTRAWILNN